MCLRTSPGSGQRATLVVKRMTHRLGSVVAVCFASSLAACAFLLDFDELQTDGQDASLGGTGGTDGGAGAGGDAATDGGGTGGDASAPECVNASDCDDEDPFTSEDCVSERCVYAPTGTLEPDPDFKLDQLTPRVLRVTLATFEDRVVLSTFAAGTNVPHQTTLRTFAVAAPSVTFDAIRDVTSLLGGLPDGGVNDETPGSAAGMLEVAGELHAFFATFKPFDSTKVWHVSLDANLAPTTSPTVITDAGITYDVGLGQSRRYPTPGIVDNDDVAAAYVLGVGSASPGAVQLRGPNGDYGTFAVGAEYAAPVSVPGGSGVAFLKSGSKSDTYGWRVGGTTQEYSTCFLSGSSWGVLSATSPVPGLTFAVYSSSHLGANSTDSRAFFCNTTGCVVTPSDSASCPTNSTEFVRNPTIHSQLTNAQPKQGVRVRLASVYPVVESTKTDLLLNVGFVDVADEGSSGGYPPVTVTSDTGAARADYPAVVVVGDRIVVAWISGANGSEMVHLRRYQLVPGQ